LRQSRAEEKVLGGKGASWVARPPEAQPSREARPFWSNGHQGGFYRVPRGGFSGDSRRQEKGGQGVQDPNAMDVDRGWGGDQRCFNCGMFRHMARHCRNQKKVREGIQKASKDQEDQ